MSIEVLKHWGDLDSVFGNGLRKYGLVSLISDEGGAVLIEHKSSWLTTSRESNLHLAFVNLVDITVSRDCEEIAL